MMTFTHRLYYMMTGVWRRRYAIAVAVILLPILGGVIGSMGKHQYQTHTSMLIQETSKLNPFLEDFGVSANLKERMSGLKVLLHSRHILTKVAEERHLIHDDMKPKERDYQVSILSDALSMSLSGTDLIKITYKSSVPEGMKEILESVTKFFLDALLAPERSSVEQSEKFLKSQLVAYEIALQTAEKELAIYKGEHADALPSAQKSSVARLEKTQQVLLSKMSELAGAKRSLKIIMNRITKANPVIAKIEERLVDYQNELVSLSARYKKKHSKVRALVRKIERLEANRLKVMNQKYYINEDRLWDFASSSSKGTKDNSGSLLVSQLEILQEAKSKQQALEGEVEQLKLQVANQIKKMGNYSENERILVGLERDLKVKRKIYEDLLKRYELAKVTRELGRFEKDERIKIIDRPFIPSTSLKAPPLLFVVGGFFGGIFLGLGVATLLEISDSSIRRQDLLVEMTGVPVLTRLPSMEMVRKYRL